MRAHDGENKIVIYQLLVRLFGNTCKTLVPYGTIAQNGVGKFNDINSAALDSIRDLGVTHCWFTGILEHATVSDFTEYNMPPDDPHLVKGRAGSPFAIRDYYDVSPDLAVDVSSGIEEFEALIERTHQTGMKVLIDFIPNHVARNYYSDKIPAGQISFGESDDMKVLFKKDNNFLYLSEEFKIPEDYYPLGDQTDDIAYRPYREFPAKVTGNDVYSASPSMNDWFETVKLNYGVDPAVPFLKIQEPWPSTWFQIRDILIYWLKKGVDGFRCDMAEMIPVEFWQWLKSELKKEKEDVLLIAEIYKPELYCNYLESDSFDYLYYKVSLYDSLIGIIKEEVPADDLDHCADIVSSFNHCMVTFLENHDEQRLMSDAINGNFTSLQPAILVSATLLAGPVMLYMGQEVGESGGGNDGFSCWNNRTSIFDYTHLPELQKWVNDHHYDGALLSEAQVRYRSFYKTLLNFCRHSEALRRGVFMSLQPFNRFFQSEGYDEKYIYSFLRWTDNECLFIVVNFNKITDYRVWIKLPLNICEILGSTTCSKLKLTGCINDNESFEFNIDDAINHSSRLGGMAIHLFPSDALVFRLTAIN